MEEMLRCLLERQRRDKRNRRLSYRVEEGDREGEGRGTDKSTLREKREYECSVSEMSDTEN